MKKSCIIPKVLKHVSCQLKKSCITPTIMHAAKDQINDIIQLDRCFFSGMIYRYIMCFIDFFLQNCVLVLIFTMVLIQMFHASILDAHAGQFAAILSIMAKRTHCRRSNTHCLLIQVQYPRLP